MMFEISARQLGGACLISGWNRGSEPQKKFEAEGIALNVVM